MRKFFGILFLLSIHLLVAQTKDSIRVVKIDENKIYSDFSELTEKPEFPGGLQKFYMYLANHYRIPEGASGKIIIEFIVEKNGSINEVKIKQDTNISMSEQTVRLFQASPNWKPGKINEIAVRTKYTLPITIKEPR
jgi:protein TonB